MRRELLAVEVEQDVLHRGVVVPQVVRGVLEMRLDLACVSVHGNAGVGVEVVALADASVEVGTRVAGSEVQEVQIRIECGGDPAVRAASRPGLAVRRPGLGAGLAGLRHHVGAPHALAGFALERVNVAAHPELPAGAPDDDHVLDDQWSDRGALAGPHIAVGLVPDLFAALGIERDDVGGQGGDEDLALRHGDAAVDVAAAQRHVERGGGPVLPQEVSVLGVEGPDPAVPARDVYDAVDDARRGLERVGRLARVQPYGPGLEDPGGSELLNGLLVDLVQRAVALAVVGAVVGQPVLRFLTRIDDALVGDAGGHRRGAADDAGQRRVVDGLSCVYVLGCHEVLLFTVRLSRGDRTTGVAAAGGRGAPLAAYRLTQRSRRSGRGLRRCPCGSRTSSSPGRRARGWPFPWSGSPTT